MDEAAKESTPTTYQCRNCPKQVAWSAVAGRWGHVDGGDACDESKTLFAAPPDDVAAGHPASRPPGERLVGSGRPRRFGRITWNTK